MPESAHQQTLVQHQRRTSRSSGPQEQPGKQVSPILGHTYVFSDKLTLSSAAFSSLLNYTRPSAVSSAELAELLVWARSDPN